MDKARLSAAQLALYGFGMPAVPREIEELPNLSGQCDAVTADGDIIDLKTRYRDVFDILSDEPRKGTPPVGKMTKAEKKAAKKMRVKGRLAIQRARARVEQYFADLNSGLAVDRVSVDEDGVHVERVPPEDVRK